jgi:hypothetical protein
MKTIRVDEMTTHADVTYNQLIKMSPKVGLISLQLSLEENSSLEEEIKSITQPICLK